MLEKMGSVTAFSVANSVKRGVVVLAGAVVMGTPMGFLPAVGATVAVLGTAAYWVSCLPAGLFSLFLAPMPWVSMWHAGRG